MLLIQNYDVVTLNTNKPEIHNYTVTHTMVFVVRIILYRCDFSLLGK